MKKIITIIAMALLVPGFLQAQEKEMQGYKPHSYYSFGWNLSIPIGDFNKWVGIAAPAFVFALYFKYLFLWTDTLWPMGPKTASVVTLAGAANSLLTLLVAGTITAIACYALSEGKKIGKPLVGAALILVGVFFTLYSLAALSVMVYASFWYLTDFWMLTLPILGIGVLVSLRIRNDKEYPFDKRS